MVVRPDAFQHPGGDVVHAQQAAVGLRELGLTVELRATDAPDARGFDLAHVFGIFEPETAARQIAAVRRSGTPLALSPIWLDLTPFDAIAPVVERALDAATPRAVEHRLERLRADTRRLIARRAATRAAVARLAQQRALVANAGVLLPASEAEADLYVRRLGVAPEAIVVAPLGVGETAFTREAPGDRQGILCAAARIESKKNQATLLYALRDLDLEITLLGVPHDPGYLARCRRWATPRTRFIGYAGPAQTRQLMACSAVHAHPSWFESPGLASLEAAAAGAHIVTGDRGCEREYFGEDAGYADPADPAAIRAAVLAALSRTRRSPGDALEQRLRARTWRAHAEATYSGYKRALAGQPA
jgi:glycosyltransferase involved in cell wall biosynthesis